MKPGRAPWLKVALFAVGVYLFVAFLLALGGAALLSAGGREPETQLRAASVVVAALAGIPAGAAGAWWAGRGGFDDRRAAITAAVIGPPALAVAGSALTLLTGDAGGAAWGAVVALAVAGGCILGALWLGKGYRYVTVETRG